MFVQYSKPSLNGSSQGWVTEVEQFTFILRRTITKLFQVISNTPIRWQNSIFITIPSITKIIFTYIYWKINQNHYYSLVKWKKKFIKTNKPKRWSNPIIPSGIENPPGLVNASFKFMHTAFPSSQYIRELQVKTKLIYFEWFHVCDHKTFLVFQGAQMHEYVYHLLL